ncbi:MAG TPA: hypothetical protein VN845_08635 [Solirubrobacteraceae bacterium]|nr:hypothetical protein [Solirubrobacteraceae bacterium]
MKPAEFLAKVRAGQRARAHSATAAAPPASAPAAEPEVAAPEPSQYVTREEYESLYLVLGLLVVGIRQHDRDQTARSDAVLERAAARPDEFDLDAAGLMVVKAVLAGGRRASSNLMDSKIRHATDAPNWAQQQTAHLHYLSYGCYPPE